MGGSHVQEHPRQLSKTLFPKSRKGLRMSSAWGFWVLHPQLKTTDLRICRESNTSTAEARQPPRSLGLPSVGQALHSMVPAAKGSLGCGEDTGAEALGVHHATHGCPRCLPRGWCQRPAQGCGPCFQRASLIIFQYSSSERQRLTGFGPCLDRDRPSGKLWVATVSLSLLDQPDYCEVGQDGDPDALARP